MTPSSTPCSVLAGWKSVLGTRCDNILLSAWDNLPIPAFSPYAYQTTIHASYSPSVVLPHSSGLSQASWPQLAAPWQNNF